ncbi:MAG: hypothetical protein L0H24_03145 [Microlunatus sp.]|nr:hypothetical protein [Microlunatus sp.]
MEGSPSARPVPPGRVEKLCQTSSWSLPLLASLAPVAAAGKWVALTGSFILAALGLLAVIVTTVRRRALAQQEQEAKAGPLPAGVVSRGRDMGGAGQAFRRTHERRSRMPPADCQWSKAGSPVWTSPPRSRSSSG